MTNPTPAPPDGAKDLEPETEGAFSVLKRGLRASPDLRRGLPVTFLLGLSASVGHLVVPIIIQQVLDNGIDAQGQVRTGFIAQMAAAATLAVVFSALIRWWTARRLAQRAEATISSMRIAGFTKIHQLPIAEHNESRRGVLVARVTSDAEALARFAQWGLLAWTSIPVLIVGVLAVTAYYSWPLALILGFAYAPALPWFRWLQRRQLEAYDAYRTRVAEMLGSFSEAIGGAAVVRAYGAQARTRQRLHDSIERRYRARMRANVYMSGVFATGDLLGAVAMAAVLVVGVTARGPLGLEQGELVAVLLMAALLQGPIGELGETLDQTQTAVAGWRKILNLLDQEIDLIEPTPGVDLPLGALPIEVDNVGFAYRDGMPVLDSVSVSIPAGANVAIVGETGSGKTTFAKLLIRLADPTSGSIRVGGVDLHQVNSDSRHARLRMVPQDGFLFDTTVAENIRYGRPGADDQDIAQALDDLGLSWWVAKLSGALSCPVGERGENLSVGERQLVALARAALADPGVLVLDEATSAVDPETDQALVTALKILARGRTTISIAHRLATAEAADLVLVFDQGRLVEVGHHNQLVSAGRVYAGLYQAWLGNTGQERTGDSSSR